LSDTDWSRARRIDVIEPGFFRLRLVKGGWKVPARIEFDEGTWTVTIDGEARSARDPYAAGADYVWTSGEAIEEWQYADLLDLKLWAASAEPTHPCLQPRKRMDPMTLPPVRFARR
jgi:hypothetical protein